jgi:hypothetical protein
MTTQILVIHMRLAGVADDGSLVARTLSLGWASLAIGRRVKKYQYLDGIHPSLAASLNFIKIMMSS